MHTNEFLLPPFRFSDHAWLQLIFFEVQGEGKRKEVGGSTADSTMYLNWLGRRKKQISCFKRCFTYVSIFLSYCDFCGIVALENEYRCSKKNFIKL